MKKIVFTLFCIVGLLAFISCEAEATASDFLSDGDLENAFDDDDEDETQEPISVAFVDQEQFVAVRYGATRNGNNMIIVFENSDREKLTLNVINAATDTFTAQNNSMNLFVGSVEYTGINFTTSNDVTLDAIGNLGLSIGDGVVSGVFNFTAYNPPNGDLSVEVINGDFQDVPIQ